MDGTALLAAYRSETADDVGPSYLWTDAEIFGYFTEAEAEAAVRKKLLRDHRSSFCQIPLVVGTTEYRIDPRIFEIQSARLQWPDDATNRYYALALPPAHEQDVERGQSGRPCALYHLDGQRRIVLDRAPSFAGVVHLEVYRRPLYAIEDEADEPEIPEAYHPHLLQYALFRGYSKRDSQTFNERRANEARQHFERVFGPPLTANQQRARSERRRITTRPEAW